MELELLTDGAFRVRNKQGRLERIHLVTFKDWSITLGNSAEGMNPLPVSIRPGL